MNDRQVRGARALWRRAAVAVACVSVFAAAGVHAQAVKSYDSTTKDFWEHPPADWFSAMRPRLKRVWRRRPVRHCRPRWPISKPT